MRRQFPLLMISVAVVVLGGAVPSAQAVGIYWTDSGSATIGHANLDGTGIDTDFITGIFGPRDVAVDGTHIYFTYSLGVNSSNAIGIANADGTSVNDRFITGSGFYPGSIAVDGNYLYWGDTRSNTIGRANLDGTGVDRSFVTGVYATSLAVDGDHIYWTTGGSGNSIGRASLDGTGVNGTFITGANDPSGLAVDGTHLYWANNGVSYFGSIGRAHLDGTNVDQTFITDEATSTTIKPQGIAVDGTFIYWSDPQRNNSIGRANLDGTSPMTFISTGGNHVTSIAVFPVPEPGTGLLVISGLLVLAARRSA